MKKHEKRVFFVKRDKIKHLFVVTKNGKKRIIIENIRFSIRYCKFNPPGMRLRIMIWLPGVHISRNNSFWEFGNSRRIIYYHYLKNKPS